MVGYWAEAARKMNKQFSHFIQRAKERYSIDLTLEDLVDIATQIKSGKAKLIGVNAGGFKYKVRCRKQLLVVVLNRSHSAFITVLPMTKINSRVSFEGKQYTYLDSLFINYQFSKCLPKNKYNKSYCPHCKSQAIEVNLGKDRFQCQNCKAIINFKSVKQPPFINIIRTAQNKLEVEFRLSYDLWWYAHLFCNNKIEHDDFIFSSELVTDKDEDIMFSIECEGYINNKIYVKIGNYTLFKLKEMLNDNQQSFLSWAKQSSSKRA